MLISKVKKNDISKGKRFLISVTVLGSAGPIRFVVSEYDLVGSVIATTLKSYAREGRLPVLGSELNDFMLYCPLSDSEGMNPWETIGSAGVRNFMLCKKMGTENKVIDDADKLSRKGSGKWKAWFNKSLSLKISSH